MKYLVLIGMLWVNGCGYSEIGSEAVGQVTRVIKVTSSMFCPAYTCLELRLGGSQEFRYMTVVAPADELSLKIAMETGKLVHVTYDREGTAFCMSNTFIREVVVLP
jgi:hypothetical protein